MVFKWDGFGVLIYGLPWRWRDFYLRLFCFGLLPGFRGLRVSLGCFLMCSVVFMDLCWLVGLLGLGGYLWFTGYFGCGLDGGF